MLQALPVHDLLRAVFGHGEASLGVLTLSALCLAAARFAAAQDKVEEYADEIFGLLDGGAHMYFCGLKGMMPGIQVLRAARGGRACRAGGGDKNPAWPGLA